ncbi:50S ribosomal protein L29 [candidate division KSB1 bacterium 4484_188]|nr:MAG: 50S ribosomal protein L29 [candidate division KSB1 bacterium 4484_188]HFE63347.1 50S ribosomal protein L29 [Caldithrix sp.]
MKPREMRELPVEELKMRLDDLVDEMANLNIQKATQQLVNPSRIRIVRKEISRIKTILREYELGISKTKTESTE